MKMFREHCWLHCVCGMAFLASPVFGTGAETCALEFRIPLLLSPLAGSLARPQVAQLVGGVAPGLKIIDGASGRLLWSADARGTTTQRFADMTAAFNASLAAVDIDGDGLHDRVYAGDVQGRLWRFDLDTSAPPSRWATGGVFADLGDDTNGRGFLAAPDITLISADGFPPWLSIAIGTANTFPPLTTRRIDLISHRFYLLRDRAPFERWTQRQYDQWTPLVEHDLTLAEGQRLPVDAGDVVGLYVNLEGNQVLAPALTLNGSTLYTVAHTHASFLPACQVFAAIPEAVPVSVGSISALDGSPVNDLNGDGRIDTGDITLLLSVRSAADSAITLHADSPVSPVVCTVAGQTLPGCALDTSLHRTFWRREDAD